MIKFAKVCIKGLKMEIKSINIVGVGYVGLDIFKKFSTLKDLKVYGTDLETRVQYLKTQGFENISTDLIKADLYIICAPTPSKNNKPDLSILNTLIKRVVQFDKNALIVLESTIQTGTCRKLKEKYNIKELCYAPERVSPEFNLPNLATQQTLQTYKTLQTNCNTLQSADPQTNGNTLQNCNTLQTQQTLQNCDTLQTCETLQDAAKSQDVAKVKLLYDSTKDKRVLKLYLKVFNIYPVNSYEIAETSKLFENVQRELNISLINEFARYCRKFNLNIYEVLNACYTKPNFMKLQPGLIGGHCLGVDSDYFLKSFNSNLVKENKKIQKQNYNFIKSQIKKIIKIYKTKPLILGVTYKPNIDDIRNSKALQLCKDLKLNYYDPYLNTLNSLDSLSILNPFNKFKDFNKFKPYKTLNNYKILNNYKTLNLLKTFNDFRELKDLKEFKVIIVLVQHSCFKIDKNSINGIEFDKVFTIKDLFCDTL